MQWNRRRKATTSGHEGPWQTLLTAARADAALRTNDNVAMQKNDLRRLRASGRNLRSYRAIYTPWHEATRMRDQTSRPGTPDDHTKPALARG
jgi:hypothetical protein